MTRRPGTAAVADVAGRVHSTFSRLLLAALAGAAFGCLAILALAGVLGILLLLTIPAFALLLAAAATATPVLVAMASRLWGRATPRATMVCSAVLTFVLFAAWPVAMLLTNRNTAGGPLFG